MTDDTIRRDPSADAGDEGPSAPRDAYVEMIRDLPRMRAIHDDKYSKKIFVPPPPMSSRISGLSQGCGGVLVTILAMIMFVAALWYGFYLWGPGLMLVGGLLLVGGTGGVWNGRRTPVVVSISALVVMAVVAYLWGSFVQAAIWLVPLGGMNAILQLGEMLILLVLIVTFISNLVSLLYWKRLKVANRRGALMWAGVTVALVILMMGLHVAQQRQRETWLEDRFQTWTAEASAESLMMGSNSNVTLGYSFLTMDEDEDSKLDVRLAEFDAVVEAGSAIIRLSASGDMLLEQETPRIFKVEEDDKEKDKKEQEAADRIARQQTVEQEFMTQVTDSGVDLMLADAQSSVYLLVWAGDDDNQQEGKLDWDRFTATQEWRVRHYASQNKPFAYEIVNDPEAYAQYNGISEPDDLLGAWIAQTERLIQVVQEESPETLIGVTLSLGSDLDMDYYERALDLDGLDFIGIRLFQPAAFEEIETILAERGHPADHGKQLWIVETWYGYCLGPQRSMDLDATWLETVAAFAAKESINAVLASDFGCFVQPGGTVFQDVSNPASRTDVWSRWRQLVQAWQ
jgi:hypothetical protein